MKPSYFENDSSAIDITFGEDHKAILRTSGESRDGYLGSDVPENHQILSQHSHVYIDGALQKGASVNVRSGIVSARSLAEDAEVHCGVLLLISDKDLSRKSVNFTRHDAVLPTILVVPEDQRAQVFDALEKEVGRSSNFQLVEGLKRFMASHSTLPVEIIAGNPMSGRELKAAGLTVTERSRER